MLSVLLHLGYGFVRASVSYPFRTGAGAARFRRAFEAEGLRSLSAEHRRAAAGFEGCIGCGRCELAFAEDPVVHDIARSLWRSPLAARGLGDILGKLEPDSLARAEELCPSEVPLRDLVRFILEWTGAAGQGDHVAG